MAVMPEVNVTRDEQIQSTTVDYPRHFPKNWMGTLFYLHWSTIVAKQKNGVNKSEEIRQMLKENPKISAREVSDALKARGIKISDKLFYLVKGKMLGRQARKKKAHKMVARVAATTGNGSSDALSTILKVKALANQVGGLKRLKAIVDALSE